jgi:hypothetical protein
MKHAAFALFFALMAFPAFAHCDSLAGPVVVDARKALEAGEVTPVLKWVTAEDEPEIRAAFAKTLSVRGGSAEAKALADRWFFETLVRVHRAGEGAAFTGLKDADFKVAEGIELADRAVDEGSLADAEKRLLETITANLRKSFDEVKAAREHASHNVEAGRHYVHAYVEFIHFVERLHEAATTPAAHAPAGAAHAGH